jgi:predicted aminopeptidase
MKTRVTSPKYRMLRRFAFVAAVVGLFFALEGCFYLQAAGGQMDVLRKRRPMDEVIADEGTDAELRQKLIVVQEARQFAVDELLLPQNGSYRSYADVERDYVVWNVFAAPEFSLQPRQWCYPVAGCVVYRGYFSEENAIKLGAKLEKDGLDVTVGGVAAYSTLGRFDDPVLNTMMRWSDVYLIETLFHELAHQQIYVKGDSAYNEAFATAVAEFGIKRWLAERGEPERFILHEAEKMLQANMRDLVFAAWKSLEDVYASELDDAQMRLQKASILNRLSDDAQAVIDNSGIDAWNWLAAPVNNATLVSVGVYQGNLSAFRMILKDCNQSFACFYEQSELLADLSFEEREQELIELDRRYNELLIVTSQPAESGLAR